MPESAPLFGRGDVVYLRESAITGFLEGYRIKSIHYACDGNIYYEICVSAQGPNITTTVGDRIRLRRIPKFALLEQDLITYCEALELVSTNLQGQLNSINALIPGSGCDS